MALIYFNNKYSSYTGFFQYTPRLESYKRVKYVPGVIDTVGVSVVFLELVPGRSLNLGFCKRMGFVVSRLHKLYFFKNKPTTSNYVHAE